MTQHERLHYYVRHMFSADSVVRSAAGAAILQGVDTPTEWGQGADGGVQRQQQVHHPMLAINHRQAEGWNATAAAPRADVDASAVFDERADHLFVTQGNGLR